MTEAATKPEPAVIDAAEQLTPGWIGAVLGIGGAGAAVRAVTTEPVGTGQMATTVRARVELDDGTDRTVVVKFGRPEVGGPMAAMAYAKEVSFYAELADRVAVRTPRCLYAAMTEGGARFALVLEDMADARPGDQIAGCSVAHAEAAVANLAGLHGPTWDDESLTSLPWLSGDGSPSVDLLAPVMAMAADQFAERFSAELTPTEAAVFEGCRELLVPWLVAPRPPQAVLHGDYRLDNLLFPASDPAGVAAVDWQTVSFGPPLRDVAFLLSTGLTVDDRRRHERELVATYHRGLAAHGVTGYGADRAWDDYRLGMMHAPLIIWLGRLTATITERGDEMFKVMWQRSSAAIDDLGSLDLIREAVAGAG